MNKQLPEDIQQNIQSYIDSGDYQNEEDVIRTAIELLGRREAEILDTWNDRNGIAIQQSIKSLSTPLDDKVVLGKLRFRLNDKSTSD